MENPKGPVQTLRGRAEFDYKIADCCDNCIHCYEKYRASAETFIDMCALDGNPTVCTFWCNRFEGRDLDDSESCGVR